MVGGPSTSSSAASAIERAWTAFRRTPIFLAEENPAELLQDRAPYGLVVEYGRKRLSLADVAAMQRNATVPPASLRRFRSCAVVGSSGMVRTRSLGREIDGMHEAVLRVNHAPVAPDYADAIGTRTTLRVVTSNWHVEAKRDPSERLLVICDLPYVPYSCHHRLLRSGPQSRAHALNPRLYCAMHRLVSAHGVRSTSAAHGRIPLTGVVAEAVALRLCDRVDTYGLSTATPDVVHASRDDATAAARSTQDEEVCQYYWNCMPMRTDAAYHARSGRTLHDLVSHARTLRAWNRSGVLRIQV